MSLIDSELAIEEIAKRDTTDGTVKVFSGREIIDILKSLQPNWCDGCKWEYAFGYGECHHCKRSYNDMYEVKDEG